MILTGWSIKGRAFTPKEYNKSALKKSFRMSYSEYLCDFARQYKNKRLRKTLLKK